MLVTAPKSVAGELLPRLREPGLGLTNANEQRYQVSGGGAVILPIYQGDEIRVTDVQGLQEVHVAGFDEHGHSCVERLGVAATTAGTAIYQSLKQGGASADNMLTKLKQFNISLAEAKVSSVLSGETKANTTVNFQADADVLMLVAAPGLPMSIDDPKPATDIVVHITRANLTPAGSAYQLAEPLAEPLHDHRIDKATAYAYEVKKGQYIQIIDVRGRQCSDLQCFDKVRLEQGIESCLDATTTRSLGGSAYPGPGLYAKFYDMNFEPMLEVVQDTCGRHDSFNTACNAKYYEDAGYPGHVNCSENFNLALKHYAVTPRRSWMAMNLFFNTFFDDDYQVFFDDPWSRPNDYVLLRALKDLVCVSSACPCDIDAANAWDPTDIHLRIYADKALFSKAIAFRKTTDAEIEMTKETGFHKNTSALTQNYTEYNGYWLPNSFNNYGAISEYWACREQVIITDLSPLRKYEVLGPDAELLLQTCVTRDIRKLAVGQVVYTAMCYESGGMIDDGTVFRLCQNNFRWIGGCDSSGLWLRKQAEALGLQAWVRDSTAQLHNIQVQGRNSRELLASLIWTRDDQTPVAELKVFRFSIARLKSADGIAILVSRTGYTGELGYEIFCHPKDAAVVWDTIWTQGQAYGITPLGLEALDILRIEAGLIFADHEFSDQTDPFEAGIAFTVPTAKEDDFIGRTALERRREHPQQQLVGLALTGNESAAHGDGVYLGKEQIGVITSATRSPILAKNIALCRLKVDYASAGTEVEVGKLDGHQKRLPAVVTSYPHFDPKKARVKGHYQ